MTETPPSSLETALARMQAAPDDTTRRLRFHAELLDTELFVLLAEDAAGDTLRPQVFDTDSGRTVLVFDSEARLAEFAGQAVPYAALPGRVLVTMLANSPEGLSLLVSPDSDHAALLAPDAIAWLAQTLTGTMTHETEAAAETFGPVTLPEGVLSLLVPALERRLRHTPGLDGAVLASVRWRGGGVGHVLAIGGVADAVRAPLARAVAEALELSGIEAGALDVIFPPASVVAALAETGLPLAPEPWVETPAPHRAPTPPGMDPARPPRLR
ncbi:MAG: SseB protein [Rhodobacteraceae bacterium HLUCCA12]|nr:MAG: SseB protein [Rhodobacteraceae bacterium HLUCCA12]